MSRRSATQNRVPCAKVDYAKRVVRKRFDSQWTSYYGTWFPMHEAEPLDKAMIGIRAFKTLGDGSLMAQTNVYQEQRTPNAKPRQQDGDFEARFEYDVATDAASEVPYNLRVQDRKDPQLMLALGDFDCETTATLPMWIEGNEGAVPILPHLTVKEPFIYRFIPLELFLSDGPHRWAICVVYGTKEATGALSGINVVREVALRLEPDEPDVLTCHQHLLAPIRTNLQNDPDEWLPAGARQGTLKAIAMDPATGDLVYLPPTNCTFRPPAPIDTPTHRFMLLPDAAYCLLPRDINQAANAAGGRGVWAEYGVRMAETGCFRIVRFEYQLDGTFKSLEVEQY